MSLIHLHPKKLNPRVHYVSPFFHPVAAELAAMERAVPMAKAPEDRPVENSRSRSALLAHDRRRLKVTPALVVQQLCGHFGFRRQCGEILHALYRAKGATLSAHDFGYSPSSISTAICQIRRVLPEGCEIITTPNLGWSIAEPCRPVLTRIIAEMADE